jgi:hypothetical protein
MIMSKSNPARQQAIKRSSRKRSNRGKLVLSAMGLFLTVVMVMGFGLFAAGAAPPPPPNYRDHSAALPQSTPEIRIAAPQITPGPTVPSMAAANALPFADTYSGRWGLSPAIGVTTPARCVTMV